MTGNRSLLRLALALSLACALSRPAAAATLTVSGVILDETGQRAGGATVVLCYVESVQLKTRDTSSRSGVYALVRLNVDVEVPKAYSIALGDTKYEDSKAEVVLQAGDGWILGKADDITRKRRLPVTFSFPFLKKEDAIARLKNLEETQTLLAKNGWKSELEAREVWEQEATKIMANVGDDSMRLQDMIMEAKGKVDRKIAPESIVPEDLRGGLLEGKGFRELKANKFDPASYLKSAEMKVPDEVVDFLLYLPPEKIQLDWLPADAAKSALSRRMGNAGGLRVVGVWPFGKSGGSKAGFPSFIEAKETSLDDALNIWTRNPDVRQSILLDFLSKEDKKLNAAKLQEIQRSLRDIQLHSLPVIQ